jgi:hypothetical protein
VPRLLPSLLGAKTLRHWRFPCHLRTLEQHCLRLADDPTYNRLVVEIPVRHGKSWYCSWMLPAWYLLTRPSRRVILASYEKEFANEWAVKVQHTIEQYGERLTGVSLGGIRKQEHFTLAAPYAGELRTASPGSGVAGKGADLIVMDDLVKDARKAASASQRHALSTWVNSELMTRLEPDGKAMAVMSRRHPDDQSGRFLAQNPELPPHLQWHRLHMSAIGEDGAALWPARWPLSRLLEIKRDYELAGQSYLWSCLYDNDPRGDSTMIEWPEDYFADLPGRPFSYDELPPDLPVKWRLLSLDPSKGKGSRRGDYSAWCDVTVDKQATMWVHPHLKVIPTEAVEDYSVELLSRNRYDAFVCECNGFQEVVADNIARKASAKGVHCPLFRKTSTEDKEVRLRLGLGPLFDQRRVRMCARSTSYRLALAQLREFPTASHDDFPDSLNLACDLINYLLTGRR